MNPQDLKKILSSGLLSFPLTDFDENGDFNARTYTERLEWLAPYGASALFAAGGTGEFFSLTPNEYGSHQDRGRHLPRQSAHPGRRRRPDPRRNRVRAGSRAPGRARHPAAAALPDRSEPGRPGRHVEEVCKSVKFGVVVYNRGACRLTPDSLALLADRCPNLIGFKDGIGDIELMVSIWRRMGDRFSYLGGLPTAEVFAQAYKALGTPVYSSAVFNFMPKMAMDFYHAVAADDNATTNRLMDEFFLPYLEIRNRKAGYAVSIVKAGARLVGHSAGPVRAPLTDLTAAEDEMLLKLIRAQGAQ
jgi:5-dehydro-4-deoxyglucarate dehydratase